VVSRPPIPPKYLIQLRAKSQQSARVLSDSIDILRQKAKAVHSFQVVISLDQNNPHSTAHLLPALLLTHIAL
jgi:hypothetical protein